jgi:hypothetical protein
LKNVFDLDNTNFLVLELHKRGVKLEEIEHYLKDITESISTANPFAVRETINALLSHSKFMTAYMAIKQASFPDIVSIANVIAVRQHQELYRLFTSRIAFTFSGGWQILV